LEQERKRLEALLEYHRGMIQRDIREIKDELQPVRNVFGFIKKFTTKDKTNALLNIGSEFAINTLLKRFVLSRTGWLVRAVVPFLVKNYSSHVISEKKDQWIDKIVGWLRHKSASIRKAEREEAAARAAANAGMTTATTTSAATPTPTPATASDPAVNHNHL
jgi:hypothetical protein